MKSYNEEIEKSKIAAFNLKIELEKKILGKIRDAWSCGCGEIHHDKAEAIEIEIPGERYSYQIVYWFSWSVKMREINKPCKPGLNYHYSVGLSEFISADVIKKMFGDAFKDVDCDFIKENYDK